MGNASAVSGSRARTRRSASSAFKFQTIRDKYSTLEQLQDGLRSAGLESSNLIVGVDLTKSNTWTGKRSFGGKCLHHLSAFEPNFYEQAITIIGRTLSPFDDDGLIPVYGFGDATTHDTKVFSFNDGDRPFHGFAPVIERYRRLVSSVRLAGPTSFAPIINKAASVAAVTGQYHILLIIADGQVTRSADTPAGELSRQEKATIDAIVEASKTPLSIVVVGVGDGPWDMMNHFDDNLPQRAFDNFQFVDFGAVIAAQAGDARGAAGRAQREARFALAALMEVPDQYKAVQALHLSGKRARHTRSTTVLGPPDHVDSRRRIDSASGSSAAAGTGAGAGEAATWVCHACTCLNTAMATICEACDTSRYPTTVTARLPDVPSRYETLPAVTTYEVEAHGRRLDLFCGSEGGTCGAAIRPTTGFRDHYSSRSRLGSDDAKSGVSTATAAPHGDRARRTNGRPARYGGEHVHGRSTRAGTVAASRPRAGLLHARRTPGRRGSTDSDGRRLGRDRDRAGYGETRARSRSHSSHGSAGSTELEEMRDELTCGICLDKKKGVVFGCGHQTCGECAESLEDCPFCRASITTRIRLFSG